MCSFVLNVSVCFGGFVVVVWHQSLKFNLSNSLQLIGNRIPIEPDVKFYQKGDLTCILKGK